MHPVIVETGVLLRIPAGDLKASMLGVKHYDGLAKVGCICAMRRIGADHSKDINSIAAYGSNRNKVGSSCVQQRAFWHHLWTTKGSTYQLTSLS